MQLLLPLLAFSVLHETWAGEIIGGHEAKPHSRPYMAYIQFWYNTFATMCGGILIHEKFVLTAAHCFNRTLELQHEDTVVLLGAHNITKPGKTEQIIYVKRRISHPQFNLEIFANDIMLLELVEKAKLTKEVQILELPKGKTQVMPGVVCQVAGWGLLAPKGNFSDTLQEVEMTVQKDKECEIRYPTYNSATQICAGDPKSQKTSFTGDSGGPFMCNNVVQAIVCFGKDDGKLPRVYTKLSPYLRWIEKTMKRFLLQRTNEVPTLSNHLSWA